MKPADVTVFNAQDIWRTLYGKQTSTIKYDTGMQIAKDVIKGQSLKKAAKARAKTAGKQFLTGAFQDLTQQGGGGRLLKRKRKATPASSRQTKKRRTSPLKFKTIFD